MPRKIRQLISDLEAAGFKQTSTRGSHRKFQHHFHSLTIILSGKTGADALPYQEKEVRRAIEAGEKETS